MIKKLSHIGIAVKDIHHSGKIFSKLFGTTAAEPEEVSGQGVKVSFFHVGEMSVEITEATSPESPIAKFISKRGEGVHHLSFEVDDIAAEVVKLKAAGFSFVDEDPRVGAGGSLVVFLHPKSTNGVLIELCEKIK